MRRARFKAYITPNAVDINRIPGHFSYYEDLYPLVRFLPGYNMPSGIMKHDIAYEMSGDSGEASSRRGECSQPIYAFATILPAY